MPSPSHTDAACRAGKEIQIPGQRTPGNLKGRKQKRNEERITKTETKVVSFSIFIPFSPSVKRVLTERMYSMQNFAI